MTELGLSGCPATASAPISAISLQSADAASKRVGLFREVLPNLTRIGILGNALPRRYAGNERGRSGGPRMRSRLSGWKFGNQRHWARNRRLQGRRWAYVCGDAFVGTNSTEI